MFNSFEERYRDFLDLCTENKFELSVDFDNWLKENGFFTAPASTKYHGAYEGGLYDHSRTVAKRLIELTKNNNLIWEREDSPFIVGMFHDLCKIDQYIKSERYKQQELPDGVMTIAPIKESYYEYNTNTILKGHGSKSIILLSQFITLSEEEIMCIRFHMGPYEKAEYEWSDLDMAIRKYSNVFFTHAADIIASKIDGI